LKYLPKEANTMAAIDSPIDLDILRNAIIDEYKAVAENPQQGFHFHTGRHLTELVGYEAAWLEGIPESSIEAFAGTGNPFSLGILKPGSMS
jgi:hypothetical protein